MAVPGSHGYIESCRVFRLKFNEMLMMFYVMASCFKHSLCVCGMVVVFVEISLETENCLSKNSRAYMVLAT